MVELVGGTEELAAIHWEIGTCLRNRGVEFF
jgi:hypothetical protein